MFKVGDIVKMDLNKINDTHNKKPTWYTDKSFTIISIPEIYDYNTNVQVDISVEYEIDLIWNGYLILDIAAMRRKKLERLKDV